MNLRVRAILTVLLVIASACAACAVPAYPGSKLTFEVTLTDQDFLPAIKAFLPTIPGIISEAAKSEGGMPEGMDKILSEDVAKNVSAALAELKSVSMSAFEMKSPDADKLLEYYTQKYGLTKGWNQVLRGGDSRGSVALFVKPGLQEMLGLAIYPQGYVVSRTTGPIDVALLTKTFASLIPAAIKISQEHKATGPSGVSGIENTEFGLKGFNNELGVTWELYGKGKVTVKATDGTVTGEATSTAGEDTPKLAVATGTETIEKEGYGTFDIPGGDGKTVMIIVVEPLAKPAK